MEHFVNWQQTPLYARDTVMAIGNFDGVHLGHQAVLARAKARANAAGSSVAVLTFEPHPRQFFNPAQAPFRLVNAGAKAHRIEKLGIDYYFEIAFKKAVAELSAEEFVKAILVDKLGVSTAVVGEDFRFGKERSGTIDTLKNLGGLHGFGVEVVRSEIHNGQEISSTFIREALTKGEPRYAASMLGHWHRIEGRVIGGEKRGRTLGFPTANMALDGLHLPRFGVYSVLVDVLNGAHKGQYQGVSSLGKRPMFANDSPNLETYIFDFSGDIYGADISVGLVDFLRPEAVFPSIDALCTQMQTDCENARKILAELK